MKQGLTDKMSVKLTNIVTHKIWYLVKVPYPISDRYILKPSTSNKFEACFDVVDHAFRILEFGQFHM